MNLEEKDIIVESQIKQMYIYRLEVKIILIITNTDFGKKWIGFNNAYQIQSC